MIIADFIDKRLFFSCIRAVARPDTSHGLSDGSVPVVAEPPPVLRVEPQDDPLVRLRIIEAATVSQPLVPAVHHCGRVAQGAGEEEPLAVQFRPAVPGHIQRPADALALPVGPHHDLVLVRNPGIGSTEAAELQLTAQVSGGDVVPHGEADYLSLMLSGDADTLVALQATHDVGRDLCLRPVIHQCGLAVRTVSVVANLEAEGTPAAFALLPLVPGRAGVTGAVALPRTVEQGGSGGVEVADGWHLISHKHVLAPRTATGIPYGVAASEQGLAKPLTPTGAGASYGSDGQERDCIHLNRRSATC